MREQPELQPLRPHRNEVPDGPNDFMLKPKSGYLYEILKNLNVDDSFKRSFKNHHAHWHQK